MKDLIVITSCRADKERGFHQAIRNTWGHNCALDYRFILGSGNMPDFADELVFDDVADDHAHCTFKTRAAHKWASENGYGFVLQVFTDTYLNLGPLLSSDYARYDYVGCVRGTFNTDADFRVPDSKGRYAYASGGMGYWTGPAATKALGAAGIDEGLMSWAEDLWAGTALGQAGFYAHHDPNYRLEAQWYLDWLAVGRIKPAEIYSLHLGRGTGIYNPQWMYDAHYRIQGLAAFESAVDYHFEKNKVDQRCDVWEYLPFFKQNARGNVLEIGTRRGNSASAFLSGVQANGGHVYGVDIRDVSSEIAFSGHPKWTFINANSVAESAFVKARIPKELNILYVDGDHSYEAVLSDLETYGPLVVPDGLIMVHDVSPENITPELQADGWFPEPGCRKAFDEYCAKHTEWDSEILPGRAGLGVIHVK